jgi:hypothetical protein
MARTTSTLPFARTAVVLGVAAALTLSAALPAQADTIIDGPVDLGTASTYGVLAGSAVTNTGNSVVAGDLGVSAGSSVTGFDVPGGPGTVVGGVQHRNDPAAALAKGDLGTAYGVAASLTPQESNITDLSGRSLSPGVYSGEAVQLADNGVLTFAGTAQSVWVIQVASALRIGANTTMVFSPGASACNVFWQVGSSATILENAQFRGTVMAQASISATDDATIVGRLLARDGAVTLINDAITVPQDCDAPGDVSTSPTITSGTPTAATAGTPYSFPVTATGSPAPTFAVTDGVLPAGLSLDTATGVVSGTPTTPGTSTFTVTASNGTPPSDSETYTVTVEAAAVVPPVVPPVTPPGVPPVTPPVVTPVVPVPDETTPTPSRPAVPAGDRDRDRDRAAGLGGDLAYTGGESTVPALVAGLALLSGTALVVTAAVRRRRAARS